MKKICEFCKIEFDTEKDNKKCCSNSCSQKNVWKNPEYREKMCKTQQEVQNRPERKTKQSASMKKYYDENPEAIEKFSILSKEIQSRPEIKEKKSKFMKEFQNRPEVKKQISRKVKEYQNRPEVKQKNIEQATYHQNRPEIKQRNSERMKKRFENPEYKNKMKKILNDYVQSDLFKTTHSIKMLELWKTDSYVNHKNKGYFKLKPYILPSGKIVGVQGYENIYLNQFFMNGGNEEDILISKSDIKEKIGIITYIQNEKQHRYFPDFYIISSNTIVEVKSKWTYEMDIENISLKQNACISNGFNFNLIII